MSVHSCLSAVSFKVANISNQDQPLTEEGFALMGAAFEVHNIQGGGLLEEIYQQSLEVELELRGIPFGHKQELTVYYKGKELTKKYIPDLFVFDFCPLRKLG